MSNSNVVYLWKWFESEKPRLEARRNCFASTRETLELRAAFSLIESPVFRRMIIETAPEAAANGPSEQRASQGEARAHS